MCKKWEVLKNIWMQLIQAETFNDSASFEHITSSSHSNASLCSTPSGVRKRIFWNLWGHFWRIRNPMQAIKQLPTLTLMTKSLYRPLKAIWFSGLLNWLPSICIDPLAESARIWDFQHLFLIIKKRDDIFLIIELLTSSIPAASCMQDAYSGNSGTGWNKKVCLRSQLTLISTLYSSTSLKSISHISLYIVFADFKQCFIPYTELNCGRSWRPFRPEFTSFHMYETWRYFIQTKI